MGKKKHILGEGYFIEKWRKHRRKRIFVFVAVDVGEHPAVKQPSSTLAESREWKREFAWLDRFLHSLSFIRLPSFFVLEGGKICKMGWFGWRNILQQNEDKDLPKMGEWNENASRDENKEWRTLFLIDLKFYF